MGPISSSIRITRREQSLEDRPGVPVQGKQQGSKASVSPKRVDQITAVYGNSSPTGGCFNQTLGLVH